MEDSKSHAYDLEERLLLFGARIIVLTRSLNGDYAERHIAKQLLRSGTSPLSNHGEAQAAESSADFIHKMKLSLMELRETGRWLKLLRLSETIAKPEKLAPFLDETDQLIRIFVASIHTAEKHRKS